MWEFTPKKPFHLFAGNAVRVTARVEGQNDKKHDKTKRRAFILYCARQNEKKRPPLQLFTPYRRGTEKMHLLYGVYPFLVHRRLRRVGVVGVASQYLSLRITNTQTRRDAHIFACFCRKEEMGENSLIQMVRKMINNGKMFSMVLVNYKLDRLPFGAEKKNLASIVTAIPQPL
jgi:hypothetical protein